MANAFVKPTYVADLSVLLLKKQIVLPGLITRSGADFAGKFNDTITYRMQLPTDANTRRLRGVGAERNLTASDLTEVAVAITLTDDVYNLVLLTDEEKTLDINDFGAQVLSRQVDAVARMLNTGVRNLITGAPYGSGVHETSSSNFHKAVLAARRSLNEAGVPAEGRKLIVGTAVEELLLSDDRYTRFDSQGDSAKSALQAARLPDLYGFDVFVCNDIPFGDAYVFHPSAFIMASRAPLAPLSGADRTGAVSAEGGFALRWIMDYDPTNTSDRSLVDTFVGYKAFEDPVDGFVRARRIHVAPTAIEIERVGSTTLTAGAGANHTLQFKAIDSNGDDVTALVDWTSSATNKATIADGTGLATGVAAGSTNISATLVNGLGTTLTSNTIAQTVGS